MIFPLSETSGTLETFKNLKNLKNLKIIAQEIWRNKEYQNSTQNYTTDDLIPSEWLSYKLC